MKILALITSVPGANFQEMAPLIPDETRHVWELYKNDVARELYFRRDSPGAVLMLECPSVEEATNLVNSLPLVKHGHAKAELIPLRPFDAWARLSAT